jgi:ribonuclease HI
LNLFGHLSTEWSHFQCLLINNGVHLQERPDTLKWIGGDSSDCIYVKNVYLASENLCWNLKLDGWRKALWDWDCPLKVKLFTWLLLENKILSWEIVQCRGFSGPGICPLCKNQTETSLHLFMVCGFTIIVWRKIKTAIKYLGNWTGTNSTLVGCFKQWNKMNKEFPTLPTLICWFTWKERNLVLFENSELSTTKIFHLTLSLLKEHTQGTKVVRSRSEPSQTNRSGNIGWFDGAAISTRTNSGVGDVIMLSDHCRYKWLLNCGPGTNTRAELLGAWALLTLASRLSMQSLHVLGDSKIIIEWLRGKGRLQVITLDCWKDNIITLTSSFQKISFSHVYRKDNHLVDILSKLTLKRD